MYAVSQGAMAVQCRTGDKNILKLLASIHDQDTVVACIAERAFLRELVSKPGGEELMLVVVCK